MGAYRLSSRAQSDIDVIHNYIAQDNREAALRMVERIEEACAFLADSPRAGRLREDLARAMRTFAVERYVICYRISTEGIGVARVLHGARDIQRVFRKKRPRSPI